VVVCCVAIPVASLTLDARAPREPGSLDAVFLSSLAPRSRQARTTT